MPTATEFQNLGAAVNTAWTNDYQGTGIKGIVCTAKDGSGASLFFPAAGYGFDDDIRNASDLGNYWSSSLSASGKQYAYIFSFSIDGIYWNSSKNRNCGCLIRPILVSGDSTRPYVEIGGVKWSTMNIGASTETDAGLYFQWGDTQGYTASQVGTDKVFDWTNYKYGNGTSSPGGYGMTKYNSADRLTTLVLGQADRYSDEITAETGKIYVDLLYNKTYRWGGSSFNAS